VRTLVEQLSRMAQVTMRERGGGKARMDIAIYCLAALEAFETLSAEDVRKITLEMGLLGRSGRDIDDPAQKSRLRSMPGDFSGFQLAAYMFVGLRKIAPDTDPGIDFTDECRRAAPMRDATRA